MVRLELTDTEAVDLKEILTYYLSELRMEIADTDSMDFRENLKRKEVFLKTLLTPQSEITPNRSALSQVCPDLERLLQD